MATAKQLAANQENARKSTGPRTRAGKKRAGKNAYRHGLSIDANASLPFEREIERIARKIAKAGRVNLTTALAFAAADLDLERVQRVKTALINRLFVFGGLEPQFLSAPSLRKVF
jgi:hypothetical protein